MPTTDEPQSNLDVLVRAAQHGDRAALERVIRSLYPVVQRWARIHVRDAADADDLTQDVLIRIVRKLRSFRSRSRFTTWVYRIVRRAAADLHRKRSRRSRIDETKPTFEPQTYVDADAVSDVRTRHDCTLTPDDRSGPHDARLRDLFDALPARQREVLALVDLEGLPATVVADQLGLAPATVRVHLLRARRALRAAILERYPELVEEYDGLPNGA